MSATTLKSYSKINIGLRILKKRDDGFHDLETIFYPVKLHDEIMIEIERSATGYNSVLLRSNRSFIPLTKDNLCYRAIENFFKIFHVRDCFKISLELKKFIPVGGGLGGGSSNAAAIIKCLVRYFKIDIALHRKKILDLALMIGSDVPFFMVMKPCYAEGRGEKMNVLPDFKIDYDILIINPNLHVSTSWAFEKINMKEESSKKPLMNSVTVFEPDKIDIFVNDFENIVFRKYEVLKTIKEELIEMGAVYSSMSGSGATMFGFFEKGNNSSLMKTRDHYNSKKYFTYISD
ncbi:MAG: 4-(cytidine 5'-diphospho)-2-C-methyl-D-erythritol kinase [Ignavibacteria bacterium]